MEENKPIPADIKKNILYHWAKTDYGTITELKTYLMDAFGENYNYESLKFAIRTALNTYTHTMSSYKKMRERNNPNDPDFIPLTAEKYTEIISETDDESYEGVEKDTPTYYTFAEDGGSATLNMEGSVTPEMLEKWRNGNFPNEMLTSLDDAVKFFKVDEKLWKIDRHVINSWPTTMKGPDKFPLVCMNYQVKAWLSMRELLPLELSIENLVEKLEKYAPVFPDRPAPLHLDGDYLVMPNMFDAHFNKREYDGHKTLAEASEIFMNVARASLARSQGLGINIDKFVYVVGQDILHSDNLVGMTTKGTAVEIAYDHRDAYDVVVDTYINVINMFAQIAPVDVIVVQSNHDRMSVHTIGKLLSAVFKNDPYVTVDASRNPRKYYRYGKTLLGFDHGDSVKYDRLPMLMALESNELWGESKYREFHIGHLHSLRGMNYYVDDSNGGVNVIMNPALCPPDEYHMLNGFIGQNQAAFVSLYDKNKGPAGRFPVFVDEIDS